MSSCDGKLTRLSAGFDDEDNLLIDDTLSDSDETIKSDSDNTKYDKDSTEKPDVDYGKKPDVDYGEKPYCGNGIVDPGEECDKEKIDCIKLDPEHFTDGVATCRRDCTGWNTRQCAMEVDDEDRIIIPDEDNVATPDEDTVINPDMDTPPVDEDTINTSDEDFMPPFDDDMIIMPDEDVMPPLDEDAISFTDIIGDDSQSGSNSEAYFKGNYFSVSSDTTITAFQFYIQPPATENIYFYVYESDTLSSGYARIFSKSVSVNTAKDFYGPSGVSIPLSAGKYYIFAYRIITSGYDYYYIYTKTYSTAFGQSEGTENFKSPNPPGTTNDNINGPGYTPASYYMTITSE